MSLEHKGKDTDVKKDRVKVIADECCSKTVDNNVCRDGGRENLVSCQDIHSL